MIPDGTLRSRDEFPLLLAELRLTGEAVEVGVWRGDFSVPFARRWPGQTLYLVDPWARLDDYDDVRNRDYDPVDYHHVLGRIVNLRWEVKGRTPPTTIPVRCTSEEAARFLPDGLDFVYIDANHSFDHVSADLDRWYAKVRPGGVLAGHDLNSAEHPGVDLAVRAFLARTGERAYRIPGEVVGGAVVNADSYYLVKGNR